MTFNPERGHGASVGHFFSFVNRILRNHLISLEKKKHHTPMSNYNSVPLIDGEERHPTGGWATRISTDQLAHMMPSDNNQNPLQLAELSEFEDFIKAHNPELLGILKHLSECSTFAEAQSRSGLNNRFFNRARLRLRVLFRSYESGSLPPLQRRVYRDRRRQRVA